jgi:hypothetical protein
VTRKSSGSQTSSYGTLNSFWVSSCRVDPVHERHVPGVTSIATSSNRFHAESISSSASGRMYFARIRWLMRRASAPLSTCPTPSALTIRLRPVVARPWTITETCGRRATLRALRVTDDVSKYSRPPW